VLHFSRSALDRLRIGDVKRQHQGAAAEALDVLPGALQAIGAARDEGDCVAAAGMELCQRASDAG